MSFPIIDMHCDLLSFAANQADFEQALRDPESHCALTQQHQGGVTLQQLAFFAPTMKGSTKAFDKQLAIYKRILSEKKASSIDTWSSTTTTHHVGYAIESASLLLEEFESIHLLEKRFAHLIDTIGAMTYISLTWNEENRFAGGNLSTKGLKPDGKRCLDLMNQYSTSKKIAIDLSHTSDQTAHDILDYIENEGLNLTPIASHSNYRAVQDEKRNLPSNIALEIGKRGGIIGLNMMSKFLGGHPQSLLDHIGRALDLHLENHIVLGADYFGPVGIPDLDQGGPYFFDGFDNSSCYPAILSMIEKAFDKTLTEKIAWKNASRYLKQAGFTP